MREWVGAGSNALSEFQVASPLPSTPFLSTLTSGPEDLIAAEAMLKRLTATPGQYSQPFVDEFKIFMKELREFFNASGME